MAETTDPTTPSETTETCCDCDKLLVGVYMLCDEYMVARCPDCFAKSRCGNGKHGEGCPTHVFEAVKPS
jgi:hypothetical protein